MFSTELRIAVAMLPYVSTNDIRNLYGEFECQDILYWPCEMYDGSFQMIMACVKDNVVKWSSIETCLDSVGMIEGLPKRAIERNLPYYMYDEVA